MAWPALVSTLLTAELALLLVSSLLPSLLLVALLVPARASLLLSIRLLALPLLAVSLPLLATLLLAPLALAALPGGLVATLPLLAALLLVATSLAGGPALSTTVLVGGATTAGWLVLSTASLLSFVLFLALSVWIVTHGWIVVSRIRSPICGRPTTRSQPSREDGRRSNKPGISFSAGILRLCPLGSLWPLRKAWLPGWRVATAGTGRRTIDGPRQRSHGTKTPMDIAPSRHAKYAGPTAHHAVEEPSLVQFAVLPHMGPIRFLRFTHGYRRRSSLRPASVVRPSPNGHQLYITYYGIMYHGEARNRDSRDEVMDVCTTIPLTGTTSRIAPMETPTVWGSNTGPGSQAPPS